MIHRLSIDAALASLQARPGGLSEEEAARRLREHGANELEQVPRLHPARALIAQLVNFFAIILWLAALLAVVADWWQPGQGMRTLALAIVAVILVNAVFSWWQEHRAERAFLVLQALLPAMVHVARDDRVIEVPAAQLVPGDVVHLTDGERVPADCRLIEAHAVRVNNATVTGESRPQARGAAPDEVADRPLEARNVLLAGTSLVSGQGHAVVFATGTRTEFGRIARLAQAARPRLSPIQREIARLSRLVAVLAVSIGGAFFAVGFAAGVPFWANLVFAIGIIVANVPEGLLPTVTLAMAMAAQRMARNRTIIRHLPSVETLGAATVICTDKTGTLTENRMDVARVAIDDRSRPRAALAADRAAIADHRRLFEGAVLCETVEQVQRHGRVDLAGDPMEVALVRFGLAALGAPPAGTLVDVVPFDSDRKRLATLWRTSDGLMLYVKGAAEVVVPRCSSMERSGAIVALTDDDRVRLLSEEEAFAADGLRVIAFAWRRAADASDAASIETDLVFSGLVGLEDPPRAAVPDAVRRCRAAGIRVIMLTGDHPHTARATAREIGLIAGEPTIVTGDRLASMSDTQLQIALDQPDLVFARIGADQKLRVVEALQRKGAIVAVTGDGVNDAPALRTADIGIAMGATGTDVAREAADMILVDDDFASIVAAIEEGRAVFENIRKFITYILTSNVPEVVPYLAFLLLRIPLPLTVIQILAVDLGTDIVPALGLGAEPPERGVMRRPPRRSSRQLIDGALLARAYLWLGPFEAAAAMAAFFFVLHAHGWTGEMLGPSDVTYLQATTACLSAIVVMQIVNVFVCRSECASVAAAPLFGNATLLAGVAVEAALILAIVYTAAGHVLVGTAPLPLVVWLVPVPFALAMLAAEEGRKRLVRASARRGVRLACAR